tara:strand:+ start:794 stop:955 length:162 start_codon:yes stop_codon:yes gene_type:complete
MSAPAAIREADAKRLLVAGKEAGWKRCEIIVGAVRVVFSDGEDAAQEWSDDDT